MIRLSKSDGAYEWGHRSDRFRDAKKTDGMVKLNSQLHVKVRKSDAVKV